MTNDEVINQEIEHPIQHHVSTATSCITEELRREPSAERTIEKVNNFRYYMC